METTTMVSTVPHWAWGHGDGGTVQATDARRRPDLLNGGFVTVVPARERAFHWQNTRRFMAQLATLIKINAACNLTIIVGRASTERSPERTLFRLCQGSGFPLRTPLQLATPVLSCGQKCEGQHDKPSRNGQRSRCPENAIWRVSATK
jgi:hypothetical protein